MAAMVRVKRPRQNFIESQLKFNNKAFNRHMFNACIIGVVALFGSFYYFLLSIEEQTERSFATKMVASALPNAAPRIIAAGKPFLVYGTAWKKEHTAEHVNQAVKAGFRFIDTACQPKHYNEAGVGEGWTSGAEELNLQRSDFYLQTKYTSVGGQDPNNIPYDEDAPIETQVKQSLEVSLRNLKTSYLDTLVMHSPFSKFADTLTAWRTMETFVDDGRVRRLGISNCYDFDVFKKLYDEARIKPSVLQNRLYADSNFDTELRAFCKEHGIWYQSFWTLTANRNALAKSSVKEWAESKQLTPQTLMYAFLMSLGYVTPLSGTTSPHHMAEDVAVMERLQGGEVIFEDEDELRRFAEILGMPDL